MAEQEKEREVTRGYRKRGRGTSSCSWVTLAGPHLVGMCVSETLGLPLTAYAAEDWRKKEGSGLGKWSADWVSAIDSIMRGRLSLASTVDQVACGGAQL